MSENIFGRQLSYVSHGDIIDPNNYNSLVLSIIHLSTLLLNHFYQLIQPNPTDLDLIRYESFRRTLNELNNAYQGGKFKAFFLAPVFTYHYAGLVPYLLEASYLINHIIYKLIDMGIEIPQYIRDKVDDAIQIGRSYPVLKAGMIVEPKHHNDILTMLKNLYDVLQYINFLCGKYDVSAYGGCLYC